MHVVIARTAARIGFGMALGAGFVGSVLIATSLAGRPSQSVQAQSLQAQVDRAHAAQAQVAIDQPPPSRLAIAEQAISLDAANTMIAAALTRARELGQEVSVVVVDAHGLQKTMVRMDNALPSSVNVAHGKAYTAAVRRDTTEAYGLDLAENERLLHSIAAVQPHMFLTPGGIPIVVDGQVIGAIGVGGAPRGLDLQMATAGIEAICSTPSVSCGAPPRR